MVGFEGEIYLRVFGLGFKDGEVVVVNVGCVDKVGWLWGCKEYYSGVGG